MQIYIKSKQNEIMPIYLINYDSNMLISLTSTQMNQGL